MNHTALTRHAILLTGVAVMMTAPLAHARSFNSVAPIPEAASTTPPPSALQEESGIVYLTGGIGDEERFALEEASHQYNLRITNVNAEGAFAGDSHISLFDAKGVQLLSADSGPLFYAAVPAGKYSIVSTDDSGIQKRKSVRVASSKATETTIIW